MRNWNFYHRNRRKQQHWLPDYLWGIETKILPFAFCVIEPASRLPMRNWNISRRMKRPRPLSRFQTTYEELKLRCSCSQSMSLLQASRLPMRNWNARWCCPCPCRQNASRLPMRNWNEDVSQLNEKGIGRLPDYLWGIETWILNLNLTPTALTLPDYLWGIETRLLITAIEGSGARLPDYLWGIETGKDCRWCLGSGRASRLPMRNWNDVK